jgi:hypothetical protein
MPSAAMTITPTINARKLDQLTGRCTSARAASS